MTRSAGSVQGTPQSTSRKITPRRRAAAAVPVSLVVFFVTLLFTATGALQLVQGDRAGAMLSPSFRSVVIAIIAVAVLLAVYSLTLGKMLEVRFADRPPWVAALIFSGVGLGLGVLASAATLSAVTLVDGVSGTKAFLALLLVLCVPAAVSGLCTRMVVDASSQSSTELLRAYVIAAVAIGLFWWSVAGYYAEASLG